MNFMSQTQGVMLPFLLLLDKKRLRHGSDLFLVPNSLSQLEMDKFQEASARMCRSTV